MNLLATSQIAWHALKVNKLRSLLTMLGIIIGVAAVIIMISIGHGAQARVEEQLKSLGANLLMILPGSTAASGVRLGSSSVQTLTEDDAVALMRDIPEIQAAGASMRGNAQLIAGNQNWATVVLGVTPDFLEARGWEVAQGRSLSAADMSGASKVILLGQTTAQQLFGEDDPIDQVIRVKNVPMVVIGVLAPKGQSLSGNDQDDIAMIPIHTARTRVLGQAQGKLRRVGAISVKVRDGEDLEEVQTRIRELLRQRHRLQPHQDDDFSLRNLTETLQAEEESSRVMTLLLAAVAGVSLLVGGIGIMNIMLVSVTERTREIGLRMAVGARRQDILWQFLVESTALALLGGMVGIVLGVGGSLLIAHLANWRVVIELGAILLATVFAAVVGIFFGYYPARKAASLLPIEALRRE
ncbi:ABC transporter permease [Parvibium lacunae]|uniref:ABC transporter permease n=1 Tax=Parvibium lacunae TaxID=1888893 RepID=A0A368L1H9_9BURK|nr:ABC transporter permease [Parvibium lacunae]RCS57392.1 ABC transporter permease [Parvibium lacunae]